MARILIIEDNADNLELMKYLLESFGHSALSAPDGPAGIAAVVRERPDLVACDIHLPGVDGYAVARAIKGNAEVAHIPLIAVTALAMVGDRDKVLRAGFDSYISKPIDPQRFVADLESFLPARRRGVPPVLADDTLAQKLAQPRRDGHVLIVDDLPTNRELMRETLQPFGYQVRAASSAAEALQMALQDRPVLIITDLHMPGGDGFSLVRALKADQSLSTLPLVMLSSSSWNNTDRELAYSLGVSRFLLRPIEPQALVDEIASCLSAES